MENGSFESNFTASFHGWKESVAVSEDLNAKADFTRESDKSLLADFGCLWAEADDLWVRHQNSPAFHGYVSADYAMVFESLARLRGSVLTMLEWGSGLGIVTIMASRMGFEAYGIEAEPSLVSYAEGLAKSYDSTAQFAQGSFIPDEFVWNPADGDEVQNTMVDVASAYDELDMELRDFDLVYAYPWPEEHTLFRNIMRGLGRQDAMLLTYDVREGMELTRFHGA
jgi:hypothetical protein